LSSSRILARMVSFGSTMRSSMRIPLGLTACPVPVRQADSSRTGGELRPSAPKETYALTTSTAQKFCIFDKTASHSTDECDAIKQLSY
jgi:hypothetical protein